MPTITTKTENETYKLAADLADKLKGGEIIALEGDLGAGKTTFTKGLAKAMGIKKHITSPTFVLMKIYPIQNLKSEIRNLIHIDCYRLDDVQELYYLGVEEYLNKEQTIVIIEWADKIKKYLNKFKNTTWINIKIQKKERQFNIKQ